MISTVGPAVSELEAKSELELAIFDTLRRGASQTEAVSALEKRWADYVGTAYAVATGSSTTAIHLALTAIGVRQGDEVIVPALAPLRSIAPVAHAGARIVFADVDEDSWTLSPESVNDCLTPRTRAILAVHLFGRAADVAALQEVASTGPAYVDVIEDAGDAAGARTNSGVAGSLGRMGCFRLSAGKAVGNAGLITTNDTDAAERARTLVRHGCDAAGRWITPGLDYGLDGLIAAFLRLRVGHIDEWIQRRTRLANAYDRILAGAPQVIPQTPGYPGAHVHQKYVICCDDPQGLQDHLVGNGVEARSQVKVAVPEQPAMRQVPHTISPLPVTRSLVGRLLALPMGLDMDEAEVVRVAELVRDFQIGRHGAIRVAVPRKDWRTVN